MVIKTGVLKVKAETNMLKSILFHIIGFTYNMTHVNSKINMIKSIVPVFG